LSIVTPAASRKASPGRAGRAAAPSAAGTKPNSQEEGAIGVAIGHQKYLAAARKGF
jgi:hypothetical protein